MMPPFPPAPGYDIFISYRHNDNLDGWVSDFVLQLEKELRGTVKDILNIYFDRNPADGLLETHSVRKSLEGKLNCRIFIPIISQTYCDPNSFAWQHELCAFNALAKADLLGRDITLSNGNVASRILPVKIHDLDAEDIGMLDKELGGALRAVEFIYREPGVNRPLRSNEEDPTKNLAHTVYRNQLNKVAQAIKQILAAMKDPSTPQKPKDDQQKPQNKRSRMRKWALAAAVVLAFASLSYFAVIRQVPPVAEVQPDKSIAVLPFVNMSNDPEQEFFSDGISEEVLNLLAKVPELKVIGRTSSFYFKGKNEDLRIIGEKLGAAHILEGSVRKEGDQVRITAQLIRASDGVHLWSDTYDRKLQKIFDLQDEIAGAVLKELKLKLLGTSNVSGKPMPNTDAYKFSLKGDYFADQRNIPIAIEYYIKSLALDSGNAKTWSSIAYLKIVEGNSRFDKFAPNYAVALKMVSRALSIDPSSAEGLRVKGVFDMFYDLDWPAAERELNEVLRLEPGNAHAYRNLSQLFRAQRLNQKAIDASAKAISVNPFNVVTIGAHAEALSAVGRFDEAIEVLKSGLEINRPYIVSRLIQVYLMSGRYDLIEPFFNEVPDYDKLTLGPMVWLAIGDVSKQMEAEKQMLLNHATGTLGSYDVAVYYAFANRKDLALDYLEKAVDEKYRVIYIPSNLLLKSLFDDPRYLKILKRMNLSPG
jgi:adenylate cyclase